MEKLTDFMKRRKAEIHEQISQLKAELRQIAAAEAAGAVVVTAGLGHVWVGAPTTIKEQVIKVLGDNPKGLEALEILRELNSRYDRNLKRESLSPQLSRLGAEGKITREGKIWILPRLENALSRFEQSYKSGHYAL